MRQAAAAFELKSNAQLDGLHILLIDDVTTSGATLVAAADVLFGAGAAKVDAAVGAHQPNL